MGLLQAFANPAISDRELAGLVTRNPVLNRDILNLIKSVGLDGGGAITSVHGAVAALGRDGLSHLAVCIGVREALRRNPLPDFDLGGFIDDGLLRAASALDLGSRQEILPDQTLAWSLSASLGIFTLLHHQPAMADEWPRLRIMDPVRRSRQLRALVAQMDAPMILDGLGEAWHLPRTLRVALAHGITTRRPGISDEAGRLSALLHSSEWMAGVFLGEDKETCLEACRRLLRAALEATAPAAEEILDEVPRTLPRVAQGLGMRVGIRPRLRDSLGEINLRLAQEKLSYRELSERLTATLEERDRLEAELRTDLNLAREIQQGLLPAPLPGVETIAGSNLSAREVSGDFYDYFRRPDGRIYFNVADVSGKGMTAALIMAKTSSLFRGLGRNLTHPGELLHAINRELCETSVRGMFVTLVAGVYDPGAGRATLVNAGHPAPLRINTDGAFTAIPAGAPPLGISRDAVFPAVDLTLRDASLYLYTDGVTESANCRRGTPDTASLASALATHAHLPPAKRLETVLRELQPRSEVMLDDATLLVVDGPRAHPRSP